MPENSMLTREQVEWVKAHGTLGMTTKEWEALCDMALAHLDASIATGREKCKHEWIDATNKAALQRKDELLREALSKIGRVNITRTACPKADTHTFGTGQSGFTINDNQEAGMIRCHTCGHRWQSVVADPLIERIQKELGGG